MKMLLEIVQRQKAGQAYGIYSVCSAHPMVLEAALKVGLENDLPVLIEATSNQVNQDGGYTGMTPIQFKEFVLAIAKPLGFPTERLILGGDHLGPNCWQSESAEIAMAKAEILIEQYVLAGFRKIHLDCSMSCADDIVPLTDDIVAKRAAHLCAVAERAWQVSSGEQPVYIIGTEVPVPGGAHEELLSLQVTTPQAAEATIVAHIEAFNHQELSYVWPRVIGLVVQPGVEFDHHKVIDYRPDQATKLSSFIESQPTLIFEAHSTDYQTGENLRFLVRDHFAILKVGPGVTYALRETLWSIADMEDEWLDIEERSNFKKIVLNVMKSQPEYWRKYYCDIAMQHFDLQFSLSDRIRYYWPHPEIQKAQETMLSNLVRKMPPMTLLSQYLPNQYNAIRQGQLQNTPKDWLIEGVAKVLREYMNAGIDSEVPSSLPKISKVPKMETVLC